MVWHLGNTTVRTPYRLREALIVLNNSPLNGNLDGKKQEQAFAKLLNDHEVHESKHVDNIDTASLHGRKWRSALYQLGFITPNKIKDHLTDQKIELAELIDGFDGLSGAAYEITPNGYALIKADLLKEQQECFLRAFASYYIPSSIEPNHVMASFSPLIFVLNILAELEERSSPNYISYQEFMFFVQTSSPEFGVTNVVNNILEFRIGRQKAAGNVRAYDKNILAKIVEDIGLKAGTISTYPDVSFRYLKATGLFKNAGRGISLNSAKAQLIKLLRTKTEAPDSIQEYLYSLWNGASLPTDNAPEAFVIVKNLISILTSRGVTPEAPLPLPTDDIRDINSARFILEEQISKLDELDYADSQAGSLDEIIEWMNIIPKRGSTEMPNGDVLKIPRGEGPAYLEWIVWRAFLAINSLSNAPWDSRRFQVDQDFLPIHCAPGGGPDMIFEFESMIVVVEVTLTASSRQEAAEGEPVRRHVAQIAEDSEKDVYGLFIALKIDSNTAHTFRYGDWYKKDDSKINLDIVPVTLGSFQQFLANGSDNLSALPSKLETLLIRARAKANQDAPLWKDTVENIFTQSAL